MLVLFTLLACGLSSDETAYTGTIEVTEMQVSSALGGRLIEVVPREGDTVAEGDLVFRLDPARVNAEKKLRQAGIGQAEAARKAAEAQVRAAWAQVRTLERELARVKRLQASGVGTAQQASQLSGQLEVARAQASAAREQVARAEAAMAQAQAGVEAVDTQMAEATVHAAIGGVVLSRNREPGEVVGPGMSVITLGDLAHPRLRVYVPLMRVEGLSLGQEVQVKLDAAEATGKIERIGSEAEFTPREILTPEERVKRVFAVDIALQPGPGVHPGMPAEALLGS